MENRRRFLKLGATLGAALTACKQGPEKKAESSVDEGPSRLGKPVSPYGERSAFEKAARASRQTKTPELASSQTPLQDTYGVITPSSLHFERHHAGVPPIDPASHRLFIHGMVERPMIFTVEELKRLPSVSRVHFVECAGNSGSEWGKGAADVQRSHGLAACSEWTGVLLSVLLKEADIRPQATWLLAEGADACKMSRSIPVKKAMDDVIVAYGQNGEPIRPEQGYPLRLVAPGFEGNINVKWVHRIKAADQPHYTKDETSKYTELMPDGTARIFTFEMDAKSVITSPSGGQKLNGRGFHEITGLAWSGRGKIEKVEVSTDGGKTWKSAELQEPRHAKAFTRFRYPWTWDGGEALLLSRATDETGYVQPLKEELIAARGVNSNYHYNGIKTWKVAAGGSVQNA